jgi:molybdopterin synthase sulfur carrier subunit
MRVRLYGFLRETVKTAWVTVAVDTGDTVGTALQRLVKQYPRLADQVFERPGVLRLYMLIAVNGRDVRDALGLETQVAPEDEMAVFPPSAGG